LNDADRGTPNHAKNVRFNAPLTRSERNELNLSPIPVTPPTRGGQARAVGAGDDRPQGSAPTTAFLAGHSFDSFLHTVAARHNAQQRQSPSSPANQTRLAPSHAARSNGIHFIIQRLLLVTIAFVVMFLFIMFHTVIGICQRFAVLCYNLRFLEANERYFDSILLQIVRFCRNQ
jgi:hypothetical protein